MVISSDWDDDFGSKNIANIIVFGAGGGGGNTVNHIIEQGGLDGVTFIAANTDKQALDSIQAHHKIVLGLEITKGLGAGTDPEKGRQAAEADREKIKAAIEGADIIFLTGGMGGGTGTGVLPYVAEMAKELKILIVIVVTLPFDFEGMKRMKIALEGIQKLVKYADSLIVIPNNKLMNVLGKTTSLLDAFKSVNSILHGAVQGISELITKPGLINVDFADVKTVMSEMGMAMMGSGCATGESRARAATEIAVSSPLLDDVDLSGALGVLVNISAGMNLSIGEFEEVGEIVKSIVSPNATVVIGTVIDADMTEELRVTIIITGIGRDLDSSQNKSSSLSPANRTGLRKPNDRTSLRESLSFERSYNKQLQSKITEESKPRGYRRYMYGRNVTSNNRTTEDTNYRSNPDKTSDDYLDIPAYLRKKDSRDTDIDEES